MWYAVFLWCVLSSVVIYFLAAIIAFATLRKHKFGRFYSVMILLTGMVRAPINICNIFYAA